MMPEEAPSLDAVLVIGDPSLPEGVGVISKTPSARAFDAVLVKTNACQEEDLRQWQSSLRSGGMVWVQTDSKRHAKRIARAMRAYFEGGRPREGERFRWVEAQGTNVFGFRRGPGLTANHFDNLAEDYSEELPEHLVDLYLEKKVARMKVQPGERGLDLGCGMGEYARALTAKGASMTAMDFSNPAVHEAQSKEPSTVQFLSGDAQRLPFQDNQFDFAYTINMLHHLKQGEQESAMQELHRVLKPGGRLYVFEINIRNPLFRFYMRKVFPRIRRIDRGDEDFRNATDFPLEAPFTVQATEYYTFVPVGIRRLLRGA